MAIRGSLRFLPDQLTCPRCGGVMLLRKRFYRCECGYHVKWRLAQLTDIPLPQWPVGRMSQQEIAERREVLAQFVRYREERQNQPHDSRPRLFKGVEFPGEMLGGRPVYRMPIVAATLMLCLLMVSGCGSILSIVKTKPRPVPERGIVTEREAEPVRRHAAHARDVLKTVESTGVPAHDPAVSAGEQSAAVVESYVGSPAERIPVSLGAEPPRFDKELAAATEAMRLLRERNEMYESEIAALRARELGLQESLSVKSSLVNRLTWYLIGAGILLVLFPSLGGPLLLWLFKRARLLSQTLGSVVSGAQSYMDEHVEAKPVLKAHIEAAGMPAGGAAEVARIKVGIKQREKVYAAMKDKAEPQ